MLRPTVICLALLLVIGCYHGPNIKTFAPAHEPSGIFADLRLRGTRVRGEVLEVQDTALIVLTDSGKVVLAAYRDIRRGAFEHGVLIDEAGPSRRTLEELRILSRYPAGMTPDVRTRLLAAYGQSEMQVAR